MIPKNTRDRDETILSVESVQRLEDELNGSDKTIWQLLSRCGLRAGEVSALQWQDADAGSSASHPANLRARKSE